MALLAKPGMRVNGDQVLIAEGVLNHDDHSRDSMVLIVRETVGYEPFVIYSRRMVFGDTTTSETFNHGEYFYAIGPAWDRFQERFDDEERMCQNAKDMQVRGVDDGVAAAMWLIDGNTHDPVGLLSRFIRGMEEGDPEVMDQLPSPRVGGEFADDPTWDEIVRDVCLDDVSGAESDDLYDVYCMAFSQGVEQEIRRMHGSYSHA